MFIYKVKFYNNFIEVKAWNAAEAKEKAFTRYVEKHNETDIKDVQVSLYDIEGVTMALICSCMDDKIRDRLLNETWNNYLDFLIAYLKEDCSLKNILKNEFKIELEIKGE